MIREFGRRYAAAGTARATAQAINNQPRFSGHGPFRFDADRNDFRFGLDHGVPYYRHTELVAPQAISQWYLGSGGNVGFHSITGMAAIDDLIKQRFEAAQELTEQLNGKYRLDAALSAQLGVLPSYTGLGMAALLPHKALDYNEGGAIRVDGLPCGSLEQRGKVLESVQGVAVKAEAFMAMKKVEGRTFIKPYRVVYVYHNQVDAVGDSTSPDMNQWKKTVSLTLEGRHFDSKKVFYLILRDAETGVEEARFDITIDLAFVNDF